jgi:muramoyltetrapeptide carboxypeptidase
MSPNIRPGSKVAVLAPSGPAAPDAYQAGLAILAARYTIVHAYTPGEAAALPYLSDDDERRVERLNVALRDDAVEAIFCARGGYGAMRLLEHLDGDALVRRRPLLVGFSDITALHAWAARLGVPTIHGPVAIQLPRLPMAEIDAMFALLEGRARPELGELETIVSGHAAGPLWGGNLTLISHLCGTPYLPDLRGHLLLLEEIGEVPYRVDRMLTQLRLAGVLRQLAGVVLGELIDCDAPPTSGLEVARERLRDLGIPVVAGAPVGHGQHNVALPLGLTAQLDADAGTLRFAD